VPKDTFQQLHAIIKPALTVKQKGFSSGYAGIYTTVKDLVVFQGARDQLPMLHMPTQTAVATRPICAHFAGRGNCEACKFMMEEYSDISHAARLLGERNAKTPRPRCFWEKMNKSHRWLRSRDVFQLQNDHRIPK
jgi:hypothetical protein